MFYLKKVIAVIENNRYRDQTERIGEKLKAEGLECECLELEALRSTAETAVSTLWISDSGTCVEALRSLGQPVLALLHEDNYAQEFGAARYACQEPWELDGDYLDRVFRRYVGLPWDILKTSRCFVRETVPEDAEAFYRIYSDASITRYTEGLFPEIEQEKQYIRDYVDKIYSFYNFGVWTVMENAGDQVIGRAGFSFRAGYEEPELGYVIGRCWQGQGYAEEVCRALLAYGWEELGFERVHAFVRPENGASLALCRKLGMVQRGEACIEGKRHFCMRIEKTICK